MVMVNKRCCYTNQKSRTMRFMLGLLNHRNLRRYQLHHKRQIIIILWTTISWLLRFIRKWRMWRWLAILGFRIHCSKRYWIRISISIHCLRRNLPIQRCQCCLQKFWIRKRHQKQWSCYGNLTLSSTIISLRWSWSISLLIIYWRCYHICFMRYSIRSRYLGCWIQCYISKLTILDC